MWKSRKYRESIEVAEAALTRLVQAGEVTQETIPSGPSGGRPKTVFSLATGNEPPSNPTEKSSVTVTRVSNSLENAEDGGVVWEV